MSSLHSAPPSPSSTTPRSTHPTHTALTVDLRDRADIDAALKQIDGPVHAVISAAGVADGTPGIMQVNFIGHRHIVEQLVEDGRLGRGGAVCMISSVAGLGWENQIPTLTDFLATPDYDAAVAWVDAHPTDRQLHLQQAGDELLRRPPVVPLPGQGASGSTPSAPARPTPRWPGPTPTCGSGSPRTTGTPPAPTT